ncbi:hybrid sensor histidine kinase/response regulator [Henriciella marina]|uniref:histidine kinase n=1 Tax=Henriciella marina TaxID=453851 RepID=A0ABT4LUX1_9PROT|nr:hybrid sensor histidine kinase/response regulator [Henriciella marina]MCZ4298174.1 hybrid sensor histidine kinase/response regulator [Henriciella marina]
MQTPEQTDALRIEFEQARLLRNNVVRSCLFVEAVIIYLTIMIVAFGKPEFAALWFCISSAMVGATYAHARLNPRGALTPTNYKRYLRGHIVVCCLTGLIWAFFACLQVDGNDLLSLFVASNMVFAITVGGMLPGSEYRPGFIALSTCTILPFAAYWIYALDGGTQMAALGIILYYLFGIMVSGQTDRDTRDGIIARRNQALTDQLVERNKQIEKASQERTRFLAATSHDLSQPLHAQGFFIETLRNELTSERQKELLDQIDSTRQGLSDLLRGIVDITRIDSGAVVPDVQTVDLVAVMAPLLQQISTQAEIEGLSFETKTESVFARTDPVLLCRIISNLLSNALRYTPAPGQVTLRLETADGTPMIEIADTGPGIPEDQQDSVFEEYVRLNPSGQTAHPGLGLGLSIVRRLTDLLAIELTLDSASGQGTRWSLALPAGHETAAITVDGPQDTESFDAAPFCIIVDDMKPVRDGMNALLTSWGCRTYTAADGMQATRLLSASAQAPDILLIDRRLGPGLDDGVEVIRQLRDLAGRQTPAILMTGDIANIEEEVTGLGIQVMLKPVAPDDLRNTLHKLLANTDKQFA